MDTATRVELAIKVISPILTLLGILFGVYQFNKGQESLQEKELVQQNKELQQRAFELEKMQLGNEFEAIAKFKEMQAVKYKEATETISSIIYSDDYASDKFKKDLERFWQLYWVELSAVEDQQVEAAMVSLGNVIGVLEEKQFRDITQQEKDSLFSKGYAVAQAIKASSKNWEFPKKTVNKHW
jgi:hypothetical protein